MKERMKLKFLVPACLFAGMVHGQTEVTDSLGKELTPEITPFDIYEVNLEDDPYAARMDSLLYMGFFEQNAEEATATFVEVDDSIHGNPDFHDTIYQARIRQLNYNTPIHLDYNPAVRSFINMYANRKRDQVSRMLGLAEYYFPMFEAILDKHDMPLELKYLAVVESALNPKARSRVGATGLWQFMYATGKLNGLKVSSYVDERSDPLLATEAACKYLTTLYNIFEDWNLALAAYNSGPGNVNKAIRRSGGKKDYWSIRPYLPRETAGYVPAFVAVNYIMNYAAEHNISAMDVKPSFFACDTVAIKEQISFKQISALIGVTEEELEFLNPAFKHKVIPKVEKDPYRIIIPSNRIGLFISNEDSIYALAQKDFEVKEVSLPTYTEGPEKIRHYVRSGQSLGLIAQRYGVRVSDIKRWNGLRSNTIRVGQRLTIYKNQPVASSSGSSSSKPKTETVKTPDGTKYTMYHVQPGDTLYGISKRYPGISAQNIKDWNNISNSKRLKPGTKLKIYNGG